MSLIENRRRFLESMQRFLPEESPQKELFSEELERLNKLKDERKQLEQRQKQEEEDKPGFISGLPQRIREGSLGRLSSQVSLGLPGVGLKAQFDRMLEKGEITADQHGQMLATALAEAGITPEMDRGGIARQVGADAAVTTASILGAGNIGGVARGGQAIRAGRLARGVRPPKGDALNKAIGKQAGFEAVLGGAFTGGRAAADPESSGARIAGQTVLGAGLGAGLAGVGGSLVRRGQNKAAQINPEEARFMRQPVDINRPEEASQFTKEYFKNLRKSLREADLTGRISTADTALTGAMSLDKSSLKSGIGPLGQLSLRWGESVTGKNKILESLSSSFMTKAGVSRRFMQKNTERLFELADSGKISRRELVGQSADAIAARHGISIQDVRILRATRQHYEEMLELRNVTREAQGRKLIERRENYVTHLKELAEQESKRAGKTITPGGRFVARRGDDPAQKDLFGAIEAYQNAVAEDLYLYPVVREASIAIQELRKQGNHKGADWMRRWIREAITKQDVPETNILGLKFSIARGSKVETVLQRINMARSISALTLSWRFLTGTLPGSIGNTLAETGFRNTVQGTLEYIFSPTVRKEFTRMSRVGALKRSQGVGVTAGGQLDFSKSALTQGRIQRANQFMTVPTEIAENFMTGAAWQAGRRRARGLNMSGKQADDFSDYIAAITQELYNPEFRPEILRGIGIRSAFPFSTFTVGRWNHLRRLTGRGGGIAIDAKTRTQQAMTLVVGISMYNAMNEARGMGALTTPGSFIPFGGSIVDSQLRERLGADTIAGLGLASGGFDRPPTAPQADIEAISRAYDNYVEHGDWNGLINQAIRWGSGLAGIGGGAQATRLIDGLDVMIRGESVLPDGKTRFEVEWTPSNLLNAITLGPFGTREGREYIQGLESASELERVLNNTIGSREDTSKMVVEVYRTDGIRAAQEAIFKHNREIDKAIAEIRANPNIPFASERIERLESRKRSTDPRHIRQAFQRAN